MFSFRFDSEKAGDREVQRTMLELLNQLDGFQPNTQVKVSISSGRTYQVVLQTSVRAASATIVMVETLNRDSSISDCRLCYLHSSQVIFFMQVIAATNRVDILDPALLRSGRLDRKIEFPMPNEEARARIMQIHSRKMNVRY